MTELRSKETAATGDHDLHKLGAIESTNLLTIRERKYETQRDQVRLWAQAWIHSPEPDPSRSFGVIAKMS